MIKELLEWGTRNLIAFDSARLDAELLLAHVLKKPATFLLAHDETEVNWWQKWRYRRLIEKRKTGFPIAYMLGNKEFYFLDFEVNDSVLIPRPDTEILVENVINYILKLETRNSPARPNGHSGRKLETPSSQLQAPSSQLLLLDVGTGSACIPISVLKNVEGLKAVVTDLSSKALSVARRNIKKHGLESRIEVYRSNLLESVPYSVFRGKEIVLTANLPYIPDSMQVMPETEFEPDMALYGGDEGVDLYQKLLDQVLVIKPKAIFLECFEFQLAVLGAHLPEYEVKYSKPLAGEARMLMLESIDKK